MSANTYYSAVVVLFVFPGDCQARSSLPAGPNPDPPLMPAGHIYIIMFSWFLSGLMGLIQRSGGAQGFADQIVRFAKTRRSTLMVCFCCGIAIFFDGAPLLENAVLKSALPAAVLLTLPSDLTYSSRVSKRGRVFFFRKNTSTQKSTTSPFLALPRVLCIILPEYLLNCQGVGPPNGCQSCVLLTNRLFTY